MSWRSTKSKMNRTRLPGKIGFLTDSESILDSAITVLAAHPQNKYNPTLIPKLNVEMLLESR